MSVATKPLVLAGSLLLAVSSVGFIVKGGQENARRILDRDLWNSMIEVAGTVPGSSYQLDRLNTLISRVQKASDEPSLARQADMAVKIGMCVSPPASIAAALAKFDVTRLSPELCKQTLERLRALPYPANMGPVYTSYS